MESAAFGPVINVLGVAGVLGWLLTQTNPRIDRLERSVNRLTQAIMLAVVSSDYADEAIKKQARVLLSEIKDA